MSHPPFPLPEGHRFAPAGDPRSHDGRQDRDGFWLAQAQQALKHRWRAPGVYPSGHLDVATQAAVIAVQARLGVEPTGHLDEDTWAAVFALDPRAV